MRALLLLLLLAGCQAPARLQIHGLSRHGEPRSWVHRDREWNEVNPGLGVQVGGRAFITAGVYENSYAELSPYAGAGYAVVKGETFELGLLGGVADYGYAKAIGFLYARAGWVQVGYAPDLGQYGGDLWTLGLSIPLN